MADVPPELAAEVQKLERYHAENPQGRYFVPLANAYRKMGALDQAEALLREGLRRHPDYLSAHIVLGRCLADRGATGEAVGEFRYVLSVDPQNLIALRSLGEMASEGGRTEEAARWYRELLAVDPMNEDARQALEALETIPSPSVEEPGSGTGGWQSPADEDAFAAGGVLDDAAIWSAGADEPADEAARPDEALAWGSVELDASAAPAAPADQAPAPEVFDSLAFGDLELTDAGSGAGADEGAGSGAAPGWDPYSGSTVELDTPSSGGEEEPAAAGEAEGDEVVTETIAELYSRQGFHDRAADVYRELIRRRGGDPALEARLREEERLAAGGAVADEPQPATAFDSIELAEEPAAPATDTDDLPLLEWSVTEAGEPGAEEPAPYAAAAPDGGDPFAASFEAGFGGADASAEPAEPAAEPAAWEEAGSEADEVAAIFAGESAFFAPPADEPAFAEAPADEASFGEAPAEEPAYAETPAWEAPAAEAPVFGEPEFEAPAAEMPAFEEPAAPEEPREPEPEVAAAHADAFRSVRDYLAGIAAWQPAGAAAVPSPAAETAPVEAEAETAPAAEAFAAEPYAPEEPAAEPYAAEPYAPEPYAAEEPAASAAPEAAADEDDMPWLAAPVSAGGGAPADVEPLEIDGLLDAESAGAAAASAGADDEPYPWELAPAAEAPAAAAPAAPEAPEAPEARPTSAFSFEEFFVEAAESPAPPPLPAPEPRAAEPPRAEPPPAQAAPADAGGDDEDLESFQAWLQSLKR